MQPIPRPIYVLHGDHGFVAQLRFACGDPSRLRLVGTWDALVRALQQSPPSALAVVDPLCAPDEDPALSRAFLDLLSGFPSASIIAAFAVRASAHGPVLAQLVECGVADVVDTRRECTVPALSRRIGEAQSRSVRRILDRALPRHTPSRTRALLTTAAEVVAEGGQATEFARALGVTVRTVARWCARADLPPVRRVLAWLRVLIAAELLDDPGRPITQIARSCGYASDATLYNAIRSFIGMAPAALRAQNAFATVAAAFGAELRDVRERNRAQGVRSVRWLN